MRKVQSWLMMLVFLANILTSPASLAQALTGGIVMPMPGSMIDVAASFTPAHLVGVKIDPNNAFKFDFIVHKGDGALSSDEKRSEYAGLLKYFLAALAVPDDKQWVNLSPYEGERIIDENFGLTEMGRALLVQDYILKQLTTSLMHPDSETGKQFWAEVYKRAWDKYGTTDVPVDALNKVWIVPDKAVVFERNGSALILDSHLKVMLGSDYTAMTEASRAMLPPDNASLQQDAFAEHELAREVMRAIIIPVLEKEVNTGRNFANLRQIVSSMILATWYKKALKASLLSQAYADKVKVKGIDQDPANNKVVWDQYVAAFSKGAVNLIREDYDRYSQEVIPRKYFSGGFHRLSDALVIMTSDRAQGIRSMSGADRFESVQVDLRPTGQAVTVGPKIKDVVDHWQVLRAFVRHMSLLPRNKLDKTTLEHSIRVAEYCYLLARPMELSSQEAEQLFFVGLIHDIGKTEIPLSILQKQGVLTPEEFAIIKMHPEIGHRLLKGFWKRLGDIAFQHHEHLDGSGYPMGLMSDQIDPWAKILAVVDVYDALVDERPYKEGQSPAQAIGLLRKANGTLDQDIVEKWASIVLKDRFPRVYFYIERRVNRIVSKILETSEKLTKEREGVDAAMKPSDDLGGIDLNQANLNMQIHRDGHAITAPVLWQDMESISIDGLVPVILDIQPLTRILQYDAISRR